MPGKVGRPMKSRCAPQGGGSSGRDERPAQNGRVMDVVVIARCEKSGAGFSAGLCSFRCVLAPGARTLSHSTSVFCAFVHFGAIVLVGF
jgi:hypothetical protein